MDWRTAPIGMVRYDELLNALLAIWRTQYRNVTRYTGESVASYMAGFEDGLDAIAQNTGLIEEFESGKATIKTQWNSQATVIDGRYSEQEFCSDQLRREELVDGRESVG